MQANKHDIRTLDTYLLSISPASTGGEDGDILLRGETPHRVIVTFEHLEFHPITYLCVLIRR
jgi:hypothetical protein